MKLRFLTVGIGKDAFLMGEDMNFEDTEDGMLWVVL
jgi:hypothetical protein